MSGVIVEALTSWLWQGALLAGLAAVLLAWVGRQSASTSYLLWWAVLVAILVVPFAGAPRPGGVTPVEDHATSPVADVLLSTQAASAEPGSDGDAAITLPPVSGWLVLLGAAGWLAFATRRLLAVAGGVGALHARKRRCEPMPTDREQALTRWRGQPANDRPTRLAVSNDALVPALLGLGRPVIAIPKRMLDQLSDDELDHVALHEHAHAQRWDDWTLLLEATLLALAGLHPGVRIATRALDRDRERACDERVLGTGGTPRGYARTVTRVAELTLGAPAPALAPGMATSSGSLTTRVERLLDRRRTTATPWRAAAMMAASLASLALAVAVLSAMPPMVTVADSAVPTPQIASPPTGGGRVGLDPVRVLPAETAAAFLEARATEDQRTTGQAFATTPPTADGVETPEERPEHQPPADPGPRTPLASRAPGPISAPLMATARPSWSPPTPPLPARAISPPWTAHPIGAVQTTAAEPNRWRKVADGGRAIGTGAAHAGKATAGAVTNAGKAIGRWFSGG